jgi:glutamate-1-semialdehyde aminotransferase
MTGHERVAFLNSGTEAVMIALRLARAATHRTKIALFNGAYHGQSDGTLVHALDATDGDGTAVPMAPGVSPHIAEDTLIVDYGTPQALEFLRAHAHELAAVLVEPVQSRRPDIQPREFLHELRAITQASGTALIFDEMVCGFRMHPGGAQAHFGIKADIATYGKIIGGGLPIGVIAGKPEYLDGVDGGQWNYGDFTYPNKDRTFVGGTFSQHPLTMAAAYAVLRYLKEQGPELQAKLNERTKRVADTLNDYFKQNEFPIQVVYCGSNFRFISASNLELLFYHMLSKGIYIWEWRACFLSTAHTDDDIDQIIRATQESVEEMRAGGFFPRPKA